MTNPCLDAKLATLSAVGTTAIIVPWTEPVTAEIADRDRTAESAHRTIQETSQQEFPTAAGGARSWWRRFLTIAAHNPPHLL
jgi:hypothetical protein